jgi:thiol-disulfide isomerase/thioredoxin
MKTTYINVSILCCWLLVGYTGRIYAQAIDHFQPATLEIHCLKETHEKAYLLKYRSADTDEIICDSVLTNKNNSFLFNLNPEQDVQYWIRIGSANATRQLCLTNNDSLVFVEDTIKKYFQLVYDRIGANQRHQQINLLPFDSIAGVLFYDTVPSAYINYIRYIQGRAEVSSTIVEKFASDFPRHVWFLRYNNEGMTYFIPYARSAFMVNYEKDHATKPDGYDFNWADTVDIHMPLNNEYHPSFSTFVDNIISIRLLRWNRRGIDTLGADPQRLNQRLKIILNSLSGLMRDDMIAGIALDADIYYHASFSIPFIQNILDTLTRIRGSIRKIAEIKKRLESIESRQAGKIAKDLMLPDSNGKMHSLSEFRGKAIFLHFWGTWCSPCREELPQVLEFERNHANDTDIVIIGIAMEYHKFDKWKKFVHDQKMSGVQLYAEGTFQSIPAKTYSLNWVPAYMVLDREGKFVSSREEPPPNEKLESDLLLAKRSKR